MTQDDRLLEAVTALTDRYHVEVIRDDNTKTRIRHRPRLRQLRDAIHPSGNKGGNGKLARERSLIDAGALDLYQRIEKHIHKAARVVGADVQDEAEIVLKRWLISARQKVTSDAFEDEWAHRFEGWAKQIDARLNPPVVVEITAPCPICGESKALDRDSGDLVSALTIRYWRSGQEGIEDAETRCGFCEAVWAGLTGARECRYDIDTAAEETA